MQKIGQSPRPDHGPDQWARFLELVPTLERYAGFVFRHTRCQETRQERIQETLSLAWARFLRLAERGLDPAPTVATWAHRCALAVRAGRSLVGGRLHPHADDQGAWDGGKGKRLHLRNDLVELVADNGATPIPDQVAFRLDFPAWTGTRSARDRRLMRRLGRGDRAGAVAEELGLSNGRISQIRRELAEDWARYAD